MLTVEEVKAALASAPSDAQVYLPGGGNARQVDVREDGVFLIGDEEAMGTPEERHTLDVLTAILKEERDPVQLAQHLIGLGARVKLDVRVPQPGDMVITPKTGKLPSEGNPVEAK